MINIHKPIVAAIALALAITWTAPAADLTTKQALNLEVGKEIAAAAEAFAKRNSWNVVIAIVDDGGHLIYLQRADGTQIGSIEIAIRKAKTTVNFKRPSKAFADRLSKGGVGLVALPGGLAFEGGVPIIHQGEVIGGIGVSGVTAQQDGLIAQAGADALAKILAR